MEKINLNLSGITYTSNPFHTDFHALKFVFNLRQGQTESMDYFYKLFGYSLYTFKFTGCYATSFPGLEKHTDDIKYSGQLMDSICLIKTDNSQRLPHHLNELENGTILG